MKIRRALFKPVVLTLFAAIGAGTLGSGDVPAQTAGTWTTAMVPIAGTVGGQSESVSFTGQAKVSSKLAADPEFNRPSLVMTIDLRGLSGVGSSSKAKYVIAGPENVQRRVAATHLIEFTFPFVKSGTALSAAQSGVASFALSFNTTNGAVISASGNVTSANPPR